MDISIQLQIPDGLRPKALYSLNQIAPRLGVRFIEALNSASIIYTTNPSNPISNSVTIQCNPSLYDCVEPLKIIDFNGIKLPLPVSAARIFEDTKSLDIFAVIFRLLTFVDEKLISSEARDQKGIFRTKKLPSERYELRQSFLVEEICDQLFQSLSKQIGSHSQRNSIWPNQKKYTLAITHDTDSMGASFPLEILSNGAKALLRRNSIFAKQFIAGIKNIFQSPENDPFFGFPLWRLIESSKKIKSTFFLYPSPLIGTSPRWNDCKSWLGHSTKQSVWDSLKAMIDNGWEFGLHPPINTKQYLQSFLTQKAFIEEKLNSPIFGIRHHYWALDWNNPHLTFRKHINAGFRYDCSIAWRDEIGFRAGTTLPFSPYDPGRERALDIIEIPTTAMDKHLSYEQKLSSCISPITSLCNRIKSAQGLTCLDWHTETSCNIWSYKGFVDAFDSIIESSFSSSDCWVATPWEIASYWHDRQKLFSFKALAQ